jgi:large subunit ribosomal protein L9
MQVILRQQMENLGNPGDVVDVKPGYARNYLIPKGLAFEATPGNLKRIAGEQASAAKRESAALGEARKAAEAFENVSLTFRVRASEEGKLFGSITTADIAEELAKQGITVDRRQIDLEEPIKSLGVTSVPVRLHAQVRPEVKVWTIKED